MHYFISAGRRTGKSTAAGLVLAVLGVRPGGFRLAADDFQPDGSCDLYMLDCRDSADFCGDHNLMYHRNRFGTEEMEEGVFDLVGVPLLKRANPAPLILMDELSEIHAEETRFQQAVLDTLNGKTPVLGVLRDSANPFLTKLRRRPDVSVFDLNSENQNNLPFRLAALLQKEIRQNPAGAYPQPALRTDHPLCAFPGGMELSARKK